MSRRHRRHSFKLSNPLGSVLPANYIPAVKRVVPNLKATFSGKGMLIKGGVAVAGAAASVAAGPMVIGALSKLPVVGGYVATAMANPIAVRVGVPAASLLVASLAAKYLPVKAELKTAILAGGAAAAIINIISPGMALGLLGRIPLVGSLVSKISGGVSGLGAYVMAPSYQGVGAYVSAPSYQGVGAYDNAVAGYVSAPNYSGSGMGFTIGANMPSFLDDFDRSAAEASMAATADARTET